MGYALPVIATAAVMIRVGTLPAPMELDLVPAVAAAPTPPIRPRERAPSPTAQRAAAIFDAARANDATTDTLQTLIATGEEEERELAETAIAIGEAYIASFEAVPAEQERAEIAAMRGRAEILRRLAHLYRDDRDTQRLVIEQFDALAITIESRALPLPTSCFRREARGFAATAALTWPDDAEAWATVGGLGQDVDTLLALRAYRRCARIDPESTCGASFDALAAAYAVPLPPDLR